MPDPTRSLPSAELPDATPADPSVTPPVGATAPAAADGDPPSPVPGYQLLDEVGRGGMGVVYRARDLGLNRDVAVKMLQDRFPAGSAAARRFTDEAQITAQLQHPGIPAVHQVGALADGRPFLAMKLIKGRTLDELLKDRPDPASDRGRFVAVYEQVCQAVGYAHAHGVIHRDLKPANVMVGAFGEVQVMDWGLAKVLAGDGAGPRRPAGDPDATLGTEVRSARGEDEATQAGSLLGTPAYMAPEQAIGAVDRVGARSDVFGLGGVLCAVLTGKPPYVGADAESTRQLAARAKLDDAHARLDACGAEPDLVALCKRCLAPEPTDRPEHAGEVAQAVAELRAAADERARRAERDRHAAEVKAAEQARRRRVVQWAAGAVAAVLLLGVAGTAAGLVRADRARHDAETQRDKAADARDKALDALDAVTSEVVGEALVRQPTVNPEQKKYLTGVVAQYRVLAAEEGDDEGARRRVANARLRVGGIEWRLGRLTEAEAVTRQARDDFLRLSADFPGRPEYRRKLGQAVNTLASILGSAGRPAEVETEIRAGLETWEALVAEFPTEPADRRGRGRARMRLASALSDLGREADAVAAFRAADEDYGRLTSEVPGEPKYRLERGVNGANLALALLQTGRAGEAEAEAGKAVAGLKPLVAEFPSEADHQLWLAIAWNNWGTALSTLGRPADAEAAFRSAVDVLERLVAAFPGNPDHRRRLSDTLSELGRMLALSGKLVAAEAPFRAAAAAAERLAADYPSTTTYQHKLAASRGNLGQVLLDLKRPAEAEPVLRSAVATQEKLVAANPDSVPLRAGLVYIQDALGQCHKALGRHADAEAVYRAALANVERVAAARPGEPQYAVLAAGLQGNLGEVFGDSGRPADALPWFDRSIAALGPEFAKNSKDPTVRLYLRNAHQNRAGVLGKLGRHGDAEAAWEQAVELTQPADRPSVRAARAAARARAGRTAEAVAEVGKLAADPGCDAEGLYNLACAVALAAAADPARREEYAGRAVTLLGRAKAGGYADLAHMAADEDLAILRDRADFRALVGRTEVAPPPRPTR